MTNLRVLTRRGEMMLSQSQGRDRGNAHRWWAWVVLCIACLLAATPIHAQPLRVMTFNVRYPTDQDGENRWDARRDFVVEMLRAQDPDVIGTQELYKRQGDELVARLPEYTWFGEARKGGADEEHMGVFYRKDRLKVR